ARAVSGERRPSYSGDISEASLLDAARTVRSICCISDASRQGASAKLRKPMLVSGWIPSALD
nr:hypothetical protein [Staphylococcus epidermidis]